MERILIIKLGAIGDVIHSLPVLSTLRACFPKAHLAWAVEEKSAPLLEDHPDLDERILLERKKLTTGSAPVYIAKWLRGLRARKFDCALDLHNLLKTGIIACASGAGERVGFRKWREGNFLFMNRWVLPPPGYEHAVEKYLFLLSVLGVREDQWVRRFHLSWRPLDEEPIERFFRQQPWKETDRVVAVNPGASWASKRWPPDRFARMAEELVRRSGSRVLVLWGPGERVLADRIVRSMTEKAVLAPPTTLKQLSALIKRCRLLISGDSGPLHIAAALGVPTVSLFGPSDPKRNGPYGESHRVIASARPPATHWQFKEHGSRWMETIGVEPVVEAALKQLEN